MQEVSCGRLLRPPAGGYNDRMGQLEFKVAVPSGGGAADVSVRVYEAKAGTGACLILGHGAGAGHDSVFMVDFGKALAGRGVETVTFNFPYTEQRRRAPDQNEVLEACWRGVIMAVQERRSVHALFVGGKSMGGRIASQVAGAPDRVALGLAGLVFLGYPLHPPGRPQQLRVAHWPKVRVPALFVQGSRDTFGTPEELRAHLDSWGAPTELLVVEDGDHSLKARKGRSLGRSQEAVYAGVQDAIAEWIRAVNR
jgi:predicted alpha/beta-hydrolase family hydrolase